MPAQYFQLMTLSVTVGFLEHTFILNRGSKTHILRTLTPYSQNNLTGGMAVLETRSLRERKVSAGVSVQALFSTFLTPCMASPTPKVSGVAEPYTQGTTAFTIFIRAAGTICKQPSRSSLLTVGFPSHKDGVGGSLDPPRNPRHLLLLTISHQFHSYT